MAASGTAAVPAGAGANPLLSGYGGPGQGQQAVLGSTLLSTPRAGGGGAAISRSAEAGGAPGGSSRHLTGTRGGPRGGAQVVQEAVHGTAAARSARGRTLAPRGAVVAGGAGEARAVPAQSDTFGLSSADFAYLALALAGLACAGLLTRWLAKTPASRQG